MKPIIFSGEMVRAILDGRKSQTRRIVKPQPEYGISECHWSETGWALDGGPNEHGVSGCTCRPVRCPYGRSDCLWVRETFATGISGCPGGVTYRADHIDPNGDGPANPIKWRPSIFMPRWASRLTLQVTAVRVERLQEISDRDVWHEGIRDGQSYDFSGLTKGAGRRAFRPLWDSVNGKRGYHFDSNPFVWVVSFEESA